MHLNENSLLKNEMKEKLEIIQTLGASLSQPKVVIEKNLGLMSIEDSRKSTFKDRILENPDEAK